MTCQNAKPRHATPLIDGMLMPKATIAYETDGRPAVNSRNAILVRHGYTGTIVAGRSPANGNEPGSWDGLIGPGKAIDAAKLFVVTSNMLGCLSFDQCRQHQPPDRRQRSTGPDL